MKSAPTMVSELTANRTQSADPTKCFQLDPIKDTRWSDFIQRHCKASVFHSVEWIEALRRTYGYKPVVYTTSAPGHKLENGALFCRIDSWLTGRRLVSLPFSDHCEPLFESSTVLECASSQLQELASTEKLKYVEFRPVSQNLRHALQDAGYLRDGAYLLHTIDMKPPLQEVFESFNRDSVQRRIARADRAGLIEKCGRSNDLLDDFFALYLATRRRHRVPPAPYAWFRNLVDCLGDAMQIRVAYKDEAPVAAILTLRFKDIFYYKYGCSDARTNNLGATPWLLWQAIKEAKEQGGTQFDLGRTSTEQLGLLTFKNHWVRPQELTYMRYPKADQNSSRSWKSKAAGKVLPLLPQRLFKFVGAVLYGHMG